MRNGGTISLINVIYLLLASTMHRWHWKPDPVCCWRLSHPSRSAGVKGEVKVCLSKILKMFPSLQDWMREVIRYIYFPGNQWKLRCWIVYKHLPAKSCVVLSAPPPPLSLGDRGVKLSISWSKEDFYYPILIYVFKNGGKAAFSAAANLSKILLLCALYGSWSCACWSQWTGSSWIK